MIRRAPPESEPDTPPQTANSPENLTDPGYLLDRRSTVFAFTSLVLGIFLATLAQTILVTALPHIVSDLGDPKEYSWIFGVYMLTSTVTTPFFGRLSDLHGRRPFFLAGVVVFLIGAAIGTFADSMAQVITARAVQGFGAGAMIPVAQAAIGDLVPPSRRGRWQGWLGGVIALAYIVGPAVGGWLADNADWRWTFAATLPVGVVTILVGMRSLNYVKPHEPTVGMSYIGSLLLGGALSGTLIAVVELGQGAALTSLRFLGPLLVGIALGVALVRHERRTDKPVLPREFLHDRLFLTTSGAGFVVGVALFAAIVYTPLLTQGVLGVSATSSGIALAPLMLANFAAIAISGDIITRIRRYRPLILIGTPVMAAGFTGLALIGPGSSPWFVVAATIVIGLGLGCLQQNLVLIMQNGLPAEHMGIVTSAGAFTRHAGGAIGIGVLGALLSWQMGAAGVPEGGGGATASVAERTELASALHPVFLVTIAVMLVGAWVVFRIPEVSLRQSVRENEPAEAEPAKR